MFAASSSTALITKERLPTVEYDLISELLISFLKYSWHFAKTSLKAGPEMSEASLSIITSQVFTDQRRKIFTSEPGAALANIVCSYEILDMGSYYLGDRLSFSQEQWLKANNIHKQGNCIQSFFGNYFFRNYINQNITGKYKESMTDLLEVVYKVIAAVSRPISSIDAAQADNPHADIEFVMAYFAKFNADTLKDMKRRTAPATFRSFCAKILDFQASLLKVLNAYRDRKIEFLNTKAGEKQSVELQSGQAHVARLQEILTTWQVQLSENRKTIKDLQRRLQAYEASFHALKIAGLVAAGVGVGLLLFKKGYTPAVLAEQIGHTVSAGFRR